MASSAHAEKFYSVLTIRPHSTLSLSSSSSSLLFFEQVQLVRGRVWLSLLSPGLVFRTCTDTEVYQYMHETITVNGCPEYQARATAKATVAAFAASEGHSHPRVVELPKTEEGLGFNVMGGKEQNSPIYISRIIPGGVAERHGGLKRGDQLLSVNGVSVEGEHHEKAVELLKAAKDSVKLVVRYTPKVLEEMEARFEKLRTARRRQQQQILMQQQQQQNLASQQNHMSLFQKKKKE
ncbi:unnamed protein product [Pleuronectes platessa]|uniref:PDZ domain-containing protein n=1 Tax=Pleuronectes platessa TaxID=8262 RepID=A0A9N7V9S0_PLEPL|nr:unnamed protein product [Pleuronectes platessa]